MLENFTIARFRFNIRLLCRTRLPKYKGATFRGGFGYAFKRTACSVQRKKCDDCMLNTKCVYSIVFETPLPQDSEMLRLYPKVPHPFVIEPPLTQNEVFDPGEELAFSLVLIGGAIDYIPYFIYSFIELGKIGLGKDQGKYELSEVQSIHPNSSPITIYTSDAETVSNDYHIIRLDDLERSFPHDPLISLSLNFLTPIRVKFTGRYTENIEFHILLRNLLRRCSSLSYFHCGERLDCDFKGLTQRAGDVRVQYSDLKWREWERYSTRQRNRMKLGGSVGTVAYTGELSEFAPFILLGEQVHVGKGTSFGLGKYEMEKVGK